LFEKQLIHITVAVFDRDEKRRPVPECPIDIDLFKGDKSADNFQMPLPGSKINGGARDTFKSRSVLVRRSSNIRRSP
jgi:hypothetical protein